jgi:hypothetical protein
MFRSIWKILPVFIVERLAKKYCEKLPMTFYGGRVWIVSAPFENVIIVIDRQTHQRRVSDE